MSSSFLRDFYRRYYGKEIFLQPDVEPVEDHIRIAKRHVSYLMTKNIIEGRSMLRHRLFLFGE